MPAAAVGSEVATGLAASWSITSIPFSSATWGEGEGGGEGRKGRGGGVIIGASLSEPHIVVISITFSCPMYVCLTSVDPIAYNRISTWKTGILRACERRIPVW